MAVLEIPVGAGERIEEISLEAIVPAPDNPRRDVGDVTELAQSMSELGILQPLIVTPRKGGFMAVVGHRRLAAAKVAGFATAPALVREYDEPQRKKAMLIENCQRSDLSVLEEARAYQGLVELGISQRDVARDVGRTQSHISKRVALLELPGNVLKALDSGGITIAEAHELLKLKDHPQRLGAAFSRRGQHFRGIEGTVASQLEEVKLEAKVAKATTKLANAGVKVVKFTGPSYNPTLPKGAIVIRKDASYGHVLKLDPAKHASEPCHAAAVDDRGDIVYVCTNRKNHPKAKTASELEQKRWNARRGQSEDGKEVRELDKARKARREFAGAIAQTRLAKDDHAELVLDALIRSAHQEVLKVATKLLQLDVDGTAYGEALRAHAAKSAIARQHVEVAIAFGTHEEFLSPYYGWDGHKVYLDLLVRHGYELTPSEKKKLASR